MGHHDHGGAAVGQLADDPQHLAGKLRIQGGGGLVEAQHVRLHAQSPGDGHPLLLAAGELVGIVPRPVGQAHLLQQGQPPVPDVRLRFAGQLGKTPGQGHVFQGGVLGKQVEILEHQTEMQALFPQLPLPHRRAGPVQQGLVPQGDHPGVRPLQEVQAPQQGGFSAAGGADDGQRLPFRQVEAHIPQHPGAAEGFFQVRNAQIGHMLPPFSGNSSDGAPDTGTAASEAPQTADSIPRYRTGAR